MLRVLGDSNTRIGLEAARNLLTLDGTCQFIQHLSHAYQSHAGELALEKAFALVQYARWRDAHAALEHVVIVPGFRENPMLGIYCGILMFLICSSSIATEVDVGNSADRSRHDDGKGSETQKQLLQAKHYLENAVGPQEGPVLLHFLASITVLMDRLGEALELAQNYCQRHPRDPHGHRILLDLARSHCDNEPHRRGEHRLLENAGSLLELDPVSVPGLAAVLQLYEIGQAGLAQVIKAVAIQVEHVAGEESLWGLLWQSFTELVQHALMSTEEAGLCAFWEERRDWWHSHFFAPSLVPKQPAMWAGRRHLFYYRALCARVIQGVEASVPFVSAVQSLLLLPQLSAPAHDHADNDNNSKFARGEGEQAEWSLLLAPPPHVFFGRPPPARGDVDRTRPLVGEGFGGESDDAYDICDGGDKDSSDNDEEVLEEQQGQRP